MLLGKGVRLKRGREKKTRYKNSYFTAISSSSVKRLQIGKDMLLTITITSNELFKDINIDNLERP